MIYLPEANGMCTKDISQNPPGLRSPAEHGMTFKNVNIRTKDNELLHGWFIYQPNPHMSKTIVYFHENAGNIGFRMPILIELYKTIKVNILLVAYRGYGQSTGSPSERGIMIDSDAILDHLFTSLKEDINSEQVYVFGKSLGGAVAIYACSDSTYKIKGLILENTFSSISSLVDTIMPFVKYFKTFLLKNFWPSVERIPKIKVPILFLISENDELIPRNHMEELHNAAVLAKFKTKHILIGATHNDSFGISKETYLQIIQKFLDEC